MPLVVRGGPSALVAGLLLTASVQASCQQEVVMRAPTGVTPDAERLLAESVEPRYLRLIEGDDVLAVARRSCGRLTPTYVDMLLSANEGDITPPGLAVIPACFVVRIDERVKVREGETWADLASRSAGIAGSRTLRGIFSSNGDLLASTGAAFTSAASIPTDEVILPVVTEPVVYTTLPSADAAELTTELRRALIPSGAAPDSISVADELVLVAGVPAGVPRRPVCPAVPRSSGAWPFPADEVQEVIDRNETFLSPGTHAAAVVAVVDNGMDRIMTDTFPIDDFAVTDLERNNPADREDQDGNGFFDDVVGTNIYDQGPPVPYFDASYPAHGTMMASLALGGSEYRSQRRSSGKAIRVKIRAVSIVRRTVEAGDNGNVTQYRMPVEGIARAIDYADQSDATIVNLSVSTPMRLSAIEDALYNRSNLLLVVAAGNAAVDLDAGSIYPASLSRVDAAYRGRVVTVAAHDKAGCLSSFSGRGAETVDLASPGEAVTATGLGGAEITDEGTSQATALVSFTAAQLRAAGLGQAAAIKERLLASVDLSPELERWLRSGGTLNIPKALSINHDVLELRGLDQRLYGQLGGPLAVETVCPSRQSDGRRVLKVSRGHDGIPGSELRLLVRVRETRGATSVLYCQPGSDPVTFIARDGTPMSFQWTEVSDLVPRV